VHVAHADVHVALPAGRRVSLSLGAGGVALVE
jgi:hypothetical protein